MGGAFLARADDATAASWNPAGLSYLRAPELSFVGVYNSFTTTRNLDTDSLKGSSVDFAAFTWPVGAGEIRGAVQLSYQRALSFDGSRHLKQYGPLRDDEGNEIGTQLIRTDDGESDGGFDVIALGTGLRLSRHLRAGFTVNRWVNGYQQELERNIYNLPTTNIRPRRTFDLDFHPRGWSFNFGVIISPVDTLNLAAVYKTPFTADVSATRGRSDYYGTPQSITEVTSNAWSSELVRLDFPSSFGVGASWRPRDTLTLSADYTRSNWEAGRIRDYFAVPATGPSDEDGIPAQPPPPVTFDELQYPTLKAVPEPDSPIEPLVKQQDAEQIRAGVEWVLIKGQVRIPLRFGYFNDRQIDPTGGGGGPIRFNGLTAGTGLIVGAMQLDFAWVYEFGEYFVASEASNQVPIRNALTTNRVYASIIYRFSGRWLP
jgi:hypothetical protein